MSVEQSGRTHQCVEAALEFRGRRHHRQAMLVARNDAEAFRHVFDWNRVRIPEHRAIQFEQFVVRPSAGFEIAAAPSFRTVAQRAPGTRLPTAFIRPHAPSASIGKLSSSSPTKMRKSATEAREAVGHERKIGRCVLHANEVRHTIRDFDERSTIRR